MQTRNGPSIREPQHHVAGTSVTLASTRLSGVERLGSAMSRGGLSVRICGQLEQLLKTLHETELVLLDPDLPPHNGLVACKAIRATSTLPVIVVGRHMSEQERIAFLDQGADDVLAWPVGEREVLARVRAHLRRRRLRRSRRLLSLGAGRIFDADNGQVLIDGQTQPLTPTEARLMRALASRMGHPFPVRELVEVVWGRSYLAASETDILRANIYRLRRKVEVNPRAPQVLRFLPGQGWVLGSHQPNGSAHDAV